MTQKRARGGQPNNQNAVKHGFYRTAFSKAARAVLKRATKLDPKDLEIEIALLRARTHELVRNDPDNLAVLTLALHALVRMMALNYSMTAEQQDDLHHTLRDLIHDIKP